MVDTDSSQEERKEGSDLHHVSVCRSQSVQGSAEDGSDQSPRPGDCGFGVGSLGGLCRSGRLRSFLWCSNRDGVILCRLGFEFLTSGACGWLRGRLRISGLGILQETIHRLTQFQSELLTLGTL